MLRLIICLVLLSNILPVFSASTGRATPYLNNRYNRTPYYSVDPYRYSSGLNALERYSMNRVYGRENDLQRIERLENLAFGAVQFGDLDTRYRQLENAILSRPGNNSYRKTIKNMLGSYLAGQATGVTPSIISSDLTPVYASGYPPQYSNSNMMQYSSFPFGRNGYRLYDQNYGTNSGIRVLP